MRCRKLQLAARFSDHWGASQVMHPLIISIVTAIIVSGSAYAQPDQLTIGRSAFEQNCASCHGKDARGAGPYARMVSPDVAPDLTILQAKATDAFDFAYLYKIITSEREVAGHGPRNSPVWGRQFIEHVPTADHPEGQPNPSFARSHVLAMITYIKSLEPSRTQKSDPSPTLSVTPPDPWWRVQRHSE